MANFSLTRRVIFYSSAWTIVSIALLGWLLLAQFRAGAERNFEELQRAQLFTLVGAVGIDADGNLSGSPNLGDSSFLIPRSGWFWRVSIVDSQEPQTLASRSLGEFVPVEPTTAEVPFDDQFIRSYLLPMSQDLQVRVLESEVEVGSDIIALFQVAANQSEFEDDINRLALRTTAILALFGAGVVAINGLILLFGLKPLDAVRKSLADIRAGRSAELSGDFPEEIEPMVSEMNVLIGNNRSIVDRARTQVGNLAHSLKTPIAVLNNEASRNKPVKAEIVRTQVDAMQSQVQNYLSRARIAAQASTVAFQTDAVKATQSMVAIMQKLNPDHKIQLSVQNSGIRFAGEKGDYEEVVGNLLENACKWAREEIKVELSIFAAKGKLRSQLLLEIHDDGPGISPSRRDDAVKRGKRLDETVPGTGLGLSIVEEMVHAYDGSIELGDSELGGLLARVRLPLAGDV